MSAQDSFFDHCTNSIQTGTKPGLSDHSAHVNNIYDPQGSSTSHYSIRGRFVAPFLRCRKGLEVTAQTIELADAGAGTGARSLFFQSLPDIFLFLTYFTLYDRL